MLYQKYPTVDISQSILSILNIWSLPGVIIVDFWNGREVAAKKNCVWKAFNGFIDILIFIWGGTPDMLWDYFWLCV